MGVRKSVPSLSEWKSPEWNTLSRYFVAAIFCFESPHSYTRKEKEQDYIQQWQAGRRQWVAGSRDPCLISTHLTPTQVYLFGHRILSICFERSMEDPVAQQADMPAAPTVDVVEDVDDDSAAFECNICYELSREPVVTYCGHLYCWPCLYR